MTLQLKPGTVVGRRLRPRPRRRARGVRRRPHPQPRRRRVAAHRRPGRARDPGRRQPDPGPAADRPRRRGRRGRRTPREHDAWPSVDLDERKRRVAAAVAEMREHRDTLALLLVWEIGKPWRLACADVDRALDGVDWYLGEIERQLAGPPAAARPGQQHRVLELPDERAGARRAGAVPGRQRRRRQDPVAGRLPHPDAGARVHEAGRAAGHAAVRRRRRARRRADQQPGDRRAGLRRRPRQRPQGRHHARRHRQAAPARAGGPQRLGHLGLQRLGRARRAPEQGLRVRQAALHRLPALRRAARAAPGVPGDLPAGGAAACASATRSPSRRRRPAARPGLRPGDLARTKAAELARALRRGGRRRRHPAVPRHAR